MRVLEKFIAIFFLVMASLFTLAPSTFAKPQRIDAEKLILGEWAPPDMNAVIMFKHCGDALCAELVDHEFKKVAETDVKNPDPNLRDRPLIGVRILEGLRMVAKAKWKDGTFYDPRTGKTYTPKIKVLDSNHVKITGCIGPGLCKGYVWTRVK